MTLGELMAVTRVHLRDTMRPFHVDDALLALCLNEAQQEAAIRARLLRAKPSTDPLLCEHPLAAGDGLLTLPGELFEISHQEWRQGEERWTLKLVSREWLDTTYPEWRDQPAGEPAYLIQDGHALQVVPAPSVAGNVLIEGYRLPAPMQMDGDEPDLPRVHHMTLIQWALHRSLTSPGTELYDPESAARAEAEFVRYFGARTDADLRADTRNDETHRIVAW